METERVHMTAPDGRTFTFEEWCDYLKEPGHDTHDEYIGLDGRVFDIDGFRFNVHGYCLNPHKIMVADYGVGFELRTFRKWASLRDRRSVWWFNIYGCGFSGASGFGHVEGDEEEAILEGLRRAVKSMEQRAQWYIDALAYERENWGDQRDTGYAASLARCKRGIAKAREEYDKRCQLTLF